ncbi:MAG: flagellar export chaperone FliS [Pseudomonadota bacterium]
MNRNQAQNYQTQQIMTASPAMLVFLLYDKAINCLKEAVRAIERGEVEARWKANGRAMEIIEHLRLTLNHDAGGEIAQNLERIYATLLFELPKVDLKNDPLPAQQAIGMLEPLRESWRQLADKGEDTARQAAQAAAQTRKAPPSALAAAPQKVAITPPAEPSGIKISA